MTIELENQMPTAVSADLLPLPRMRRNLEA